MSISILASHLREGSTIASMFNSLKDGKVQKFSTFRAKYVKLGVKRPKGMLFRLCRLLRAYTDMQINFSGRKDFVQMVKRDRAVAAREAAIKASKATKSVATAKPAAKSKSKPVTKKVSKPVTKPVAKKKVVTKKVAKPHTTKPVAVAAGVDDDDIIEA